VLRGGVPHHDFPDAPPRHSSAKVRDRDVQNTPTVRTLLPIDRALGWQPRSAAVILLGGNPLSVTARTTKGVRAKERAAKAVTRNSLASAENSSTSRVCTGARTLRPRSH
jgi:hypothetical protein